MEDNTQKAFSQQTLDALRAVVEQAATAREGTYSERNPLLGKMVRCRYCHKRRRQNAQQTCCSAYNNDTAYIIRAMQTDKDGNETIPMTPKVKGRKNPRLTRQRPPLFLMRQILLDLESDPATMPLRVALLQDSVEGQVHGKASKWGHTPQKEVAPAHVAAFIEKIILRDRKLSAKRIRNMQKESRRRNRC